ncbi:MAG: hypothetical protein ER33_04970 [Cyanobium sp. CACIAM 14]|nr:MAG: hypothetical protein ER33_04970 [Cyanobium sp. CACIAM 14]
MALADSGKAIGAVTRLLRDHLIRRGFEVSVGKPELAAEANTTAKLNLFLYETQFDPSLRNTSLHEAEPPPIWLVLRYLLTAFDDRELSDSPAAHELLGRGLSALQDLNPLRLDSLVAPDVRLALESNPEPLKLTFDESSVDLLSKIMQGTDERYRLSVAFQMRPVMIAPAPEPRTSLLVGVDYSTTPQTVIGDEGVAIRVLPTLGPRLQRVEPDRFETGTQIDLFGDDLDGSDLEVVLGDVVLTPVQRLPDRLRATVEGDPGGNPQGPIAAGTALSAGELPLIVRRRLSATRRRSSNLLAASLLPTLATAALVSGDLVLTGLLLGEDSDDVLIAFHRSSDGATVRTFDGVTTTADQQRLTVPGAAAAAPAGTYRVILLVNNQQARSSPSVTVL